MGSVTFSVVSHAQDDQVHQIIDDLKTYCLDSNLLLTHNLLPTNVLDSAAHPYLTTLVNSYPKGFAANHNRAFNEINSPFYAVINPDIRLSYDPIPKMLQCMEDPTVGLVIPKVINSLGQVEDNIRFFPTIHILIKKFFGVGDGRYSNSIDQVIPVEWGAGMFMLFRSEAFKAIGGFDPNFFLYYEDVDICARLWKAGWKVVHQPHAVIVHDAQRASRVSWQYRKWHFMSMARYFFKHWGRLPKIPLSN